MRYTIGLLLAAFQGLVVTAASAQGGAHLSNGGDVIVCNGRPTEMLDLYEGRAFFGFTPGLGDPDMTPDEKVEVILDRMHFHDPDRAARYRSWHASFREEAAFMDGIDLTDIDDSHHLALPTGCSIAQIAIQRTPRFPGEKRYVIDNDLWALLDHDNQASLILHEIIYREGVGSHHEDSVATRYFNAYITAASFTSVDFAAYVETLRAARLLAHITVDGVVYHLGTLTFHDNGQIAAGVLTEVTTFPTGDGTQLRVGYATSVSRPLHWGRVRFFADGSLQAGCLDYPASLPLPDGQMIHVDSGSWIELDANGALLVNERCQG